MAGDEQLGAEGAAGMRCAEAVDLMTEALENALTTVDRLLFWSHLAGCEACRIHLEQLRLTIQLIGEAGRLASSLHSDDTGTTD